LSYDELATSYQQQMEAMLEGGVDAILIETIFDTLNAKAAIFAAGQAMKVTGIEVPVMLSVTVSDIGGRTLSGQTLEAFLASVQHANIFSVGLNCSFGARQLKPFLEQLASRAPYYISAKATYNPVWVPEHEVWHLLSVPDILQCRHLSYHNNHR